MRPGSPIRRCGAGRDAQHELRRSFARARAAGRQGPRSSTAGRDGRGFDRELAGLDLREVEDVVDDRAAPANACSSRRSRAAPGRRAACRAAASMPSTPFIGVRISWLIVARKSLFARFAPSAASFADTRALVRVAQVARARFDFGLELLAVTLQLRVAVRWIVSTSVEAVHEVATRRRRAARVRCSRASRSPAA